MYLYIKIIYTVFFSRATASLGQQVLFKDIVITQLCEQNGKCLSKKCDELIYLLKLIKISIYAFISIKILTNLYIYSHLKFAAIKDIAKKYRNTDTATCLKT